MSTGTIHVAIQDLKKVSYDVDADPNITIGELKDIIAQKYDVVSKSISLVLNAKILKDNEILSSTGVQDGSVFKIHISKAGGRSPKSSIERKNSESEKKPVVEEVPKKPVIVEEPPKQAFTQKPKYSTYENDLSFNESSPLNRLPSPLDTPAPVQSEYDRAKEKLMQKGMSSEEVELYYQMFSTLLGGGSSKSQDRKIYQSIADNYKRMVDNGTIQETPESRQSYEKLREHLNQTEAQGYSQGQSFGKSYEKFYLSMAKYYAKLYEEGYYQRTPDLDIAYQNMRNYIDSADRSSATSNQGSFFNQFGSPKVEEVPMYEQEPEPVPEPKPKPKPVKEPAQNANIKKTKQNPRELLSKMTSAQQLECNRLYIEGFSMEEVILIYSACDYEYETALAVLNLD